MAIPKKKPAPKRKPVTPLDKWLRDHGRTQLWLADELGISTAAMHRITMGVNMPRRRTALLIRELTGISLERLARAIDTVPLTEEQKAARIQRGQKLIARGQEMVEAATR